MGLLNVGSLILGLIAWILPIINLINSKKPNHNNWYILSVISMSACAISLCFQIIYNYHLVKIADWSALMDTTGAVAFLSVALLTGTIILNTITLVIYRNRTVN